MKKENILAVTKLGVDYGWFTLVTMNGTELTVYNHGLKWEVDNTQKEAEIMVLKTDDSGQVMHSIIRGTKKAIENFMYSVGYGTANKKSDGVYQHTIAELQSKTQNLIWEIEELKEKLELKLAE